VLVDLDGFTLAASPDAAAIRDSATVKTADGMLRLGGTVRSDRAELDVLLDLIDLDEGFWQPTLTAGAVDHEPGIVLTESAADDLGVAVGDTVVLRHPLATGPASLTLTDTEILVAATHPYPMRPVAYMDIDHAGIMNLDGVVNGFSVLPEPGAGEDEVRRELFSLESVAAVRPAAEATEQVRDALGQVMQILQVISFFALLLAFLIAVNSAGIALDARKREHASMFAFGVPVRTALRMSITESFLVGLLATLLGIAGGFTVVWWMLTSLLGDTMPDLAAVLSVQPATIAVAAFLGIVTVALAPVFTVRRMRKMDLPGTLRLVE
jgi:putative ABC transport system permease protein